MTPDDAPTPQCQLDRLRRLDVKEERESVPTEDPVARRRRRAFRSTISVFSIVMTIVPG